MLGLGSVVEAAYWPIGRYRLCINISNFTATPRVNISSHCGVNEGQYNVTQSLRQQKSPFQFVVVLGGEDSRSGVVRCPGDLDDDGRSRAVGPLGLGRSTRGRPQHAAGVVDTGRGAAERPSLTDVDETSSVLDRNARRYTGACRRPVHLPKRPTVVHCAIGRFKGRAKEAMPPTPNLAPNKFQERLSGASIMQENLLAAGAPDPAGGAYSAPADP